MQNTLPERLKASHVLIITHVYGTGPPQDLEEYWGGRVALSPLGEAMMYNYRMVREVTEVSVWQQLETVIDPEIGYSIVGLGLVYNVSIDSVTKRLKICFTLTSPACPLEEYFRQQIKQALNSCPDWEIVLVMTFEPPWSAAKIRADVAEQLALSGMPVKR